MSASIALIAAAAGYLLGSISFARLVFARLRPGTEPDLLVTPTTDGETGLVSHAVGATNVMVAFGPRWGMATMALDAAKAFIPTLAFNLAFPGQPYDLICAAAVLTGHLWPVWYRFSGGGGHSSILGMLLAISPVGAVVTHAGGLVIGRFAPKFAYLSGVVLTIPWFVWRNGPGSPEVVFAVTITVLYFFGQLPEILEYRRLRRAGYELDVEYTMRMMKSAGRADATGVSATADSSTEDDHT